MTSQLPRFIDPSLLAERRAKLAGHFEGADFPRLQLSGARAESIVAVELEFCQTSQGVKFAQGQLGTTLELTCQRCLQAFNFPLVLQLKWEFVGAASAEGELGDEFDPISVESVPLGLSDLIEDDILLALPIAPMHSAGACPATSSEVAKTRATQRPFAALAALRNAKK